jgi:hypothetical protein
MQKDWAYTLLRWLLLLISFILGILNFFQRKAIKKIINLIYSQLDELGIPRPEWLIIEYQKPIFFFPEISEEGFLFFIFFFLILVLFFVFINNMGMIKENFKHFFLYLKENYSFFSLFFFIISSRVTSYRWSLYIKNVQEYSFKLQKGFDFYNKSVKESKNLSDLVFEFRNYFDYTTCFYITFFIIVLGVSFFSITAIFFIFLRFPSFLSRLIKISNEFYIFIKNHFPIIFLFSSTLFFLSRAYAQDDLMKELLKICIFIKDFKDKNN